MSYKNRAFSALAVLIAATATSAAMASDGTINFNGELKAETCKVSVNGGSATGTTVTLPTLSSNLLATAGQVAGATNFLIQLSECDASINTAAAYFEAGSTVDPLSGNLKNTTGGATKVQLQLLDATNGSAIKAGSDTQVTSTSRIAVASDRTAVLPYSVQYYSQGSATPGTVVSAVTYSINYQ